MLKTDQRERCGGAKYYYLAKRKPRGGVNIYEDPSIQFLICRLSSGVVCSVRGHNFSEKKTFFPLKTSGGLK